MGRNGKLIILSIFIIFEFIRVCDGDLNEHFYDKSCPEAEQIVRNITWNRAASNSVLGAKLLRMLFHDCFVRGCDGSILLDPIGSDERVEKQAIPNLSLSGFDVIDDIKTELENICPETVSCADILALAARDAVSFQFQKSMWNVEMGRRDGFTSLESEANASLPSPFSDFTTLMQLFAGKNLDVNDLVVLSGGHTIGVGHCATFTNRLYDFNGNGGMDPTLDETYAQSLKTQCPNPEEAATVEMDPQSSLSFDKNYYDTLLQNKGLFESDAALLTNQESARIVRQLKTSNAFFAEFAISMKKMGAIDVLTGNDGQIRKNCRIVNP